MFVYKKKKLLGPFKCSLTSLMNKPREQHKKKKKDA
jgi:hypothetical protein